MSLIGCGHGKPPVDDGEEMSPPDLPGSEECGDETLEPSELCLEQVTTPFPKRRLQSGDFDGDGLVDFVHFLPRAGGQDAILWKGDGSGGFALHAEVGLDDVGDSILSTYAANLDGNPWTDLLGVEVGGSGAQIRGYINDGPWSFGTTIDSQVMGAGEPWNSVVVFDADSDGRDDLIAEPFATSGTLHIVANSDGGFDASGLQLEGAEDCWFSNSAPIPGFSAFVSGVVFVPGECDGVETSTLTVILSQMGGDVVSYAVPTAGSTPSAAAAGDFDGDESVELLVWDRGLSAFELFRANFVGSFSKVSTLGITELCPPCTLSAEDPGDVKIDSGYMDGDPASDIMLSFGSELYFGLNPLTGTARWTKWQDLEGPVYQQMVVDLDSDGIYDAVFADAVSGTFYVLLNRY